jgi:hypothetical protein
VIRDHEEKVAKVVKKGFSDLHPEGNPAKVALPSPFRSLTQDSTKIFYKSILNSGDLIGRYLPPQAPGASPILSILLNRRLTPASAAV